MVGIQHIWLTNMDITAHVSMIDTGISMCDKDNLLLGFFVMQGMVF